MEHSSQVVTARGVWPQANADRPLLTRLVTSMHTQTTTTPLLEKYITEDELAQALNVSKRSIATYRAQRVIPFMKIGRQIRFNPGDVKTALAQLTVRPT